MNDTTKSRGRWLLLVLGIAAFGYLLYFDHPHESKIKVGNAALDFNLPSKTGLVSLDSLKGKVILLNFWATWCPPCREEMPSMEKLHQKMAGRSDFVIIAVNVDKEGWPAVDGFLKRLPVTFPILIDPDGRLAKSYGTELLPESYLIDKKGIIVQKYEGPEDWTTPDILQEVEKATTQNP